MRICDVVLLQPIDVIGPPRCWTRTVASLKQGLILIPDNLDEAIDHDLSEILFVQSSAKMASRGNGGIKKKF
ncbi:hypothetical protein RRG08_065161 [Elysia crispata]|uniref:Uncharacterized protein n=1 Tax=Elysia crispata TaxID=231223 RepID=A0AAE0Z080_9GAST|nr:hypothetical protein RRG08_065161 [Elysia crispata]